VAERLAREASREDVHQSVKLSEREGVKIRPDRVRIQLTRFHLRDQVRAGEGFDLHRSDCSAAWEKDSLESEVDASVSNAE
jgi:hypothetical protein